MVVIEAALAACPIVATEVGVADMYIHDDVNGFVCYVGDARCLAYKIGRLISEKNLGRVLATRAKALIEESLHDKEQYLSLYHESWQNCCLAKDAWEE